MLIMKDGVIGPAKMEAFPLHEPWVVHIVGPDDVIEKSGELDALRSANAVNIEIERERRRYANDPNYPYSVAIARKKETI